MASVKPTIRPAYYSQEYYARIRYSNALPPPPCPPKFVEIPGTEPASGRYTSVAYTAKLAREQPLCIEVDSELGMPLDFVGIPGVFEDDWHALDMSVDQREHHPADLLLLRPIHAITGKSEVKPTHAAFLRRGEHVQAPSGAAVKPRIINPSSIAQARDPDAMRDVRLKCIQNWTSTYPDSEILSIMRRGNLLDAEGSGRRAIQKPVHPLRPRAQLLQDYSLAPNLRTVTDTGSYYSLQLKGPPREVHERYDESLDVSIVRPMELSDAARTQYEARQQAYEADAAINPPPGPEPLQYEMYKPETAQVTSVAKRRFDPEQGVLNDVTTDTGKARQEEHAHCPYLRSDRYETDLSQTRELGGQTVREVAMVLVDKEAESERKDGKPGSALWNHLIQHISLDKLADRNRTKEARSGDREPAPSKLELIIRDEDKQEAGLRRNAAGEVEFGSEAASKWAGH